MARTEKQLEYDKEYSKKVVPVWVHIDLKAELRSKKYGSNMVQSSKRIVEILRSLEL